MPLPYGTQATQGNTQGSHYFLNINSGQHITHNNWTVLPMLTEVIKTAHRIATICKNYKGIVFTNKHGNIINNETPTSNVNVKNLEITGVYGDITGVERLELLPHNY